MALRFLNCLVAASMDTSCRLFAIDYHLHREYTTGVLACQEVNENYLQIFFGGKGRREVRRIGGCAGTKAFPFGEGGTAKP